MEVILKQDMDNLGYADDIVKVKSGYARNYLIPKGFAVVANEANKKINQETVKQRAFKINKIREEAEKIAESLKDVVLTVPVKVGEKGKLFGSVTTQQLADVLGKMGHTVDKKQIHILKDHIKEMGTYHANVTVHRDVKAEITFEVVKA